MQADQATSSLGPGWMWPAVLSVVVLVGCAAPQHPAQRAPVVDRTPVTAASAAERPLPTGAENAGRPGFYTVRPGDTLIRIGLETGQNWRDIQAWNGLANPDRIEVGQVLRVVPPEPAAVAAPPAATVPAAAPTEGTTTQPIAAARAPSRPLTEPATEPATAPAPAPAAATAPATAAAPAPAPAAGTESIRLIWPANGPVLAQFDQARNKGLAIGGRAGDPVVAAADGRVVYAGAGLRGYGNLVILKHNNTYLTAYAHNQALLVREDQNVRQGQPIAQMGSSDADRVKLHFEVRRQGRPIDPINLLPAR